MLARKPRMLVAVALANRMARIAWALMTNKQVYKEPGAGRLSGRRSDYAGNVSRSKEEVGANGH